MCTIYSDSDEENDSGAESGHQIVEERKRGVNYSAGLDISLDDLNSGTDFSDGQDAGSNGDFSPSVDRTHELLNPMMDKTMMVVKEEEEKFDNLLDSILN